jgi:hypothetical protein
VRRWWLILLAGCGFHSHSLLGDGGAGSDAATDSAIDSSIDGSSMVTSPRRLVINSTASAALTNFRLYVPLDASTIDYAAVTTPATDLRFHDETANVDLQFEVDHWNPAGESGVWIKVGSLPSGTSNNILMYFGASANGISNPSQVWGSYELVNHMESSLSNSANATVYQGSAVNVATMAGQVGNAATFAGTGDSQMTFTFGNQLFDAWSAFTLETWLYPDYATLADIPVDQPRIMEKGVSLTLGRLYVPNTALLYQVDLHFTGNNDVYLAIPVPLRQWSFVVYTFDGAKVRAYLNGQQVDMQQMSGGSQMLEADSEQYYLGDPVNPLAGSLDELRIEQSTRGGEALLQEYRTMMRQMVTFTDP